MDAKLQPAPIAVLTGLTSGALAALAGALRRAGYDDRILGKAERVAPNLVDRVRLPLVHRALERDGTPPARLAHLFVYDGAPPADDVRSVLGDGVTASLLDAGVLEEADGRVRARFRLLPFGDTWIFCDHPSSGRDAVMGAGPATLALTRLLPGRMAGSYLDLGCGAGALALVAARRGATAVGTDLNPRAVSMARVNAALNGLGAEFLAGDLLEPLGGRRFELVVSQPPFVIQPEHQDAVTYVHGGPRGDAVVARLVSALPEALAPGGRAIVRFDAALGPDEQLHPRVQGWLGEGALDLALVTAPAPSPDMIALGYGMLEDPTLGETYAQASRRYRDHIDRLGVTEFHQALALFRAGREGKPGGRFSVQLPVRGLGGLGPAALEALLASLDLATENDQTLLRAAVRPSPGARFVEVRRVPGETDPDRTVRFAPGVIGVEGEPNPSTWRLIGILADAGSVADALGQYAALTGSGPDEERGTVLDFVRRGLAEGVLVPAASAPRTRPG